MAGIKSGMKSTCKAIVLPAVLYTALDERHQLLFAVYKGLGCHLQALLSIVFAEAS